MSAGSSRMFLMEPFATIAVVTADARRIANYDDIVVLPVTQVGELVDGTLYAHARPASAHASAMFALAGELAAPFRRGRGGPGGWILVHEPELHVGGDVLVPDLAGWRRERMPELPLVPFFDLAPDWVCEVLSPSTESFDRGAKLRAYARERMPCVWLVDPIVKTLELFVLDGETYRFVALHADDAVVRVAPFDAIELELAALWAR